MNVPTWPNAEGMPRPTAGHGLVAGRLLQNGGADGRVPSWTHSRRPGRRRGEAALRGLDVPSVRREGGFSGLKDLSCPSGSRCSRAGGGPTEQCCLFLFFLKLWSVSRSELEREC